MQRLLLALLLAGGLCLPMVTTRPQPALADLGDDVSRLAGAFCEAFGGCQPFGTTPCPIFEVGASAPRPGLHGYRYEEECAALPGRFSVGASYDVDTKEAQEKLKALSGAWTITASWRCGSDPWIFVSPRPTCTNVQGLVTMSGQVAPLSIDWSTMRFPLSAGLLEDQYRPVLSGQLQNALRQQQTPAAQPAPKPTLTWPELSPGANGEAVRTVQYLLREHGADVVVDGDFGGQTGAAVAQFRAGHGLAVKALRGSQVNQVVTPETWAALIVTVGPGSQGEAVTAVQSQLASRGIDIAVDGDFGEQTSAAVTEFRRDHGLLAPGTILRGSHINQIVTPETWAALVNGK